MYVHTNLSLLPTFKQAVVTIGSFDGIHLGHQKIIHRINQLSKKIHGESVLITFDPHPRQILYPNDDSLELLTSREEKIKLLKKFGIDHVVFVPFSIEFSQQSPREYVDSFLVKHFKPAYIVIGYDHRFGLNRQGDVRFLQSHAGTYNYQVIQIEKEDIDDIAISSTKIRTAIKKGDIRTANRYLNYPYLMSGHVVHGKKIGTKIGYKTANIAIDNPYKLTLPTGIYAVHVLIDSLRYGGMLYVGYKPTVQEQGAKTIEVHIFDFDQDIYDEKLSIEIIDLTREDQKFDSLEALRAALAQDEIEIRTRLQQPLHPSTAKVALAILNYNGQEIIEQYLPTTLYASDDNLDFWIIDNASTDNSVEYVKEWHPEYKCIQLKTNYGYAGGYNVGLKGIHSDYIVLLNSDVRCTPNWIDPLLQRMEAHPEIAAMQPKVLSIENPDSFEYAGAAGGLMDVLGYPFCRGRLFDHCEKDTHQYDDVTEIFWASGAAMIIRKNLFEQFGGFDADYFAHQEEIDLAWRLKNAGYQIWVDPSVSVYHLGGGTLSYENPKKTYLNFRNNLVTIIKNEQRFWLLKFFIRLKLDGVAGVQYFFKGKFQHVKAIIQAHFYIYKHFRSILKKRQKNQSLIKKYAIGKPNNAGRIKKSIVWSYFVLNKKSYSQV